MTVRSGLSLAVAVLVCTCAFAQPAVPQPTRRALLIGINDYKAVGDLAGCVNDIELIRSVLIAQYGFPADRITMLRNSAATRAGILDAIATLTQQAKPTDTIYIHYSGHGSRMLDRSKDEPDQWDETIVPHDSRQGGIYDISDDELNQAFGALAKKCAHLVVVLDSCHSGSATRGGATIRRAEDDLRVPPPPAPAPAPTTRPAESPGDLREYGADYVLIAGCRPHELSNESDAGGARFGALSYNLARALRNAPPGATYRSVVEDARSGVTQTFPTQHPNIEGPLIDNVLFESAQRPAEPYFLVSGSGAPVRIDGGSIAGVAKGAELDVYAPNTTDFNSTARLGTLTVTTATPLTAEATVTPATVNVPRLARAVLRQAAYEDFLVRVLIDPTVSIAHATALRALLQSQKAIVITAEAADAHLIVRRTENALTIAAPDLDELGPRADLADSKAVKDTAERVAQWARWIAIRDLDNKNTPKTVDFRIENTTRPGATDYADGDRVRVTVTNNSTSNAYITLVDLSTDGSILPWYPPVGQEEFVAPASTMVKNFELFVPDDRKWVQDTVKMFATDAPLNPRVFIQTAIRGDLVEPAKDDPRLAFIESTAVGAARGGRPVPISGWQTQQRTFRIVKEPARSQAFLFHYDAPRSTPPSNVRGCGGEEVLDPRNPCLTTTPFIPSGEIFEATLPINADGSRGIDSMAGAWDEAYRLRATTGATRVEPVFEMEDPAAVEVDADGTRGGIQRPDKPAAKQNTIWSLQHARVPDAWAMLAATGRRDGEEGLSVTIGHPDTGYREHAEIWAQDESKSPILYRSGYNFFEDNDTPFDNMAGGLLTNPGHGTKSSSVIISPKGKQWSGGTPSEFVTGVAPGAHLVPLRVHKSVVHLDSRRLAKAIFEASGDDRTRVKRKADVISISMGGLPSWALWRAVRAAEKAGVIVVAAAGNEVGFVVWPARFSEVVAVAASNVECGIWDGSSRGSAVDITAPGESVWMAVTNPAGVNSIGRGQGTTFATATTAGVAALWLDYHRNDPALARLRQSGQVTSAFRRALQATAWRPDGAPAQIPANVQCVNPAPWNAGALGPGIVNAAGALGVALSQSAARALEPSFQDLPLFSTLFPDSTDEALVNRRYARLLGIADGVVTPDTAELEAEILTHYAIDRDVRAALDALTLTREPSDSEVTAARAALSRRDISSTLRARL